MPITFNGVTIPENVANALSYNGVNITQVIYDGVTVWQQSLFSAQWSGNSLVSNNYAGILASGNLCAWKEGVTGQGAWIAVSSSGTWSENSTNVGGNGMIIVGGNSWRVNSAIGSIATFTLSTRTWSGSSINSHLGYQTSGGLIQAMWNYSVGPWISLT